MAEYNSLPELRADLTAEDPDERAQAYSAVLSADLDVSDVLSSDPPEDQLVKEDVIPAPDSSESFPAAAKTRQETVSLLEDILEELKQMNGGS